MRYWVSCALVLLGLAGAVQAAPPKKWDDAMKLDDLMLMKTAAERGDPEAQFLIGLQYQNGDGLPLDRTEAEKWLRKAAVSDHAEAQHALGLLYAAPGPENGLANSVEAEKWLRKAAEQENLDAISLLSDEEEKRLVSAVEKGNPVSVDVREVHTASRAPVEPGAKSRQLDEAPAETVRWSLTLSGLRGADAFLVRGFMLENGIFVNRDLAAAAYSYRKAALKGDPLGQYRLGLMYAEGRGVARDPVEAAAWLSRAAINGSLEAGDELARLKATLKPVQTEASASETQERSGPVKKP